jgi:hypothetical protein
VSHLTVSLHLSGAMWWVCCALTVYRLTRLVVTDSITQPLRNRVSSTPRPRVAYFLACPWCVGFWMALTVAALVSLWPSGAAYIVLVLSWSAATGIIAERTD